jgi:hypothetical protein
MKRDLILARRNLRGTWLAAAVVCAATTISACGDVEEGDTQSACRDGTSVVLTNDTGQRIKELQIRSLEETGPYRVLVDAETGLPSGGQVGWVDCSTGPQALLITLGDGTQQQSDLPTLDTGHSRLRMTAGGVVTPPPAPKAPTGHGLVMEPAPASGPFPQTR